MVAVINYKVAAKRWKFGWELHIEDLTVTQCRTLATAEATARECVSLLLEVPEDSFGIEIVPELPFELLEEAVAAREETRRAAQVQRHAAARSRAVVKRLKAEGLSHADVGAVMHIKPARVSQLAK